MPITYPCRETVKNKRLVSKRKRIERNMHIYKSHDIIMNYKGKLLALVPSTLVYIICICLEDRNAFARFDEIQSMIL